MGKSTFNKVILPPAAWPERAAPGIRALPVGADRLLLAACKAVDKDIELCGAVMESTVDKVRAALAKAGTA